MKRCLYSLALVVLASIIVGPQKAKAQGYIVFSSPSATTPGVDMPLFDFREWFGRDTFSGRTATAMYSRVLMENTDNDNFQSEVLPGSMSLSAVGNAPIPHFWYQTGAGPAVYPQRPPRISYRESTTYNGIDFRGVVPPFGSTYTYTQYAFIEWGPGTGRYSGRFYDYGYALIAFDYTVTP